VNDPRPSRRPAPRLDDFPHRLVQNVRFRDLDRQNHVNNAVFMTFFESGRVDLLYDPTHDLAVPGTTYVIAHIAIDFRGEMRWPGDVEIGTAIARLGTSSLDLAQALFMDGICVATAASTLVLVDEALRRPCPFPAELAARIRAAAPAPPRRV
jgi:acyl-CoA thioester hydrolase